MNNSVSTIVRCLAVLTGIIITLITASLLTSRDPDLVAAEERFSNLSSSNAHRVQVTFDLLEEPQEHDQRHRVEQIHRVASEDPTLNQQLVDFGVWWETLSEAARDAIRDLPEDRWADEVRAQMHLSETEDETIVFQFQGSLRDRSRRGRLRVDVAAIDSFLKDAVTKVDLNDQDKKLLEAVGEDDVRLARSLVITGRLFPMIDRGQSRVRPNRREIERIFALVNDHLPDEVPEDLPEQAAPVVYFGILSNIINHEMSEFRERYSQTQDLMEQEFVELSLADRKQVMLSDPTEAERTLHEQLLDSGKRSPENQLAARLTELREARKRLSASLRRSGFRPPQRQPRSSRGERPPQGNGREGRDQ